MSELCRHDIHVKWQKIKKHGVLELRQRKLTPRPTALGELRI